MPYLLILSLEGKRIYKMEKGEGMKHWIESIISVNFLHYLCKLNKKKLDIFQRLHEIYNCNLIFCMIVC